VTPLPEGMGLALDRSVRTFRHGTVLVGGQPGRLITLTAAGADSLTTFLDGGPVSVATRQLGRRLVRAGMAHPRRGGPTPAAVDRSRTTVVVPVRDRSDALDRCLGSLGPDVAVVVVDDGSEDPVSVERVCRRHRARLISRSVNGGPAAARNEALASIDSELVAFLDSDCSASEDWLAGLVWLFDDPEVAAVAPRVRPEPSVGGARRSVLARFSSARSALDMGPDEGEVGPDRRVRYVPTAALVVRTASLGRGFDPGLRVGEDVDLVWRLLDEGGHVRYVPEVTVHHREPSTWGGLLTRRLRYGTSAGPLSRRHPDRLALVELRPWPTAAVAALMAGRPRVAAAVVVASAAVLACRVRPFGIPPGLTVRWAVEGAGWTAIGLGRAATMLAGPAVVCAAWRSRRTAVTTALLVLTPPVVEWWRRRPDLDPGRWTLACMADDVAYGAGVWIGCLRERSLRPLLPAVRLRPRPEQD
jgi:mycofactocin system glycosyltransferase